MRLINKYNLLLLNVENDEVIDCVNILIKKKILLQLSEVNYRLKPIALM